MYIKIDDKNKVITQIADKFAERFTADNKTSFKVASVPSVERDEVLYYNPETNAFYTEKKPEPTEEQKATAKARAEARAKKEKALKWLADNDWKVNKHVLGEWTDRDRRWLEYLDGRSAARAAIDEADYVLNNLRSI